MKVEVNTESKNTLYTQGEYPVGHITRVLEDYVRRAELFDKMYKNLNAKISELTANGEDALAKVLIEQLELVGQWWDGSYSYKTKGDFKAKMSRDRHSF
jgi:hypothetical protein